MVISAIENLKTHKSICIIQERLHVCVGSHRYPLNFIILFVFFCNLARTPGKRAEKKKRRFETEERLEKRKDHERESISFVL